MPHVTKQDWSKASTPWSIEGRAQGYDRLTMLSPDVGDAVHTDLGIGRLQPGGRVDLHLHSYEEAVYVLEGTVRVQIDGKAYLLQRGDYAFFPIGCVHGFSNDARAEARWLDVNSPVALRRESGRRDTFFPKIDGDMSAQAKAPDFTDPTLALVGHYEGTAPDHVSAATSGDARNRSSAGMNTAVLSYSGISVKMMVDELRGANLLNMFMVDYEVNGAAQVHDHPFEEAYFFLEGDTDFELDGVTYHVEPGDLAWAGVGETHACFNTAGGRVRWIETQSPLPPVKHSYRWPADWQHFEHQVCEEGTADA
jgi:quercetin dioxygenase-like cupin family protein